jgi:sterol desaturase/sphingolipid hydroxylase (fatty acid hydroxylase superfamily)
MTPPLSTALFVLGVFIFLFAVEKHSPLRRSRTGLITRLLVNGAVSAMAFLVAATIVRPSAALMMNWASAQQFGLVHVLGRGEWPQFVAGFLLLDLSFYYWHVANHKIRLLWRFHNVHHLDPDLDVSTGFRFHFGEVLLSTVFRIVQVSATGISLTTFAAYEVVFQANTLFHHSNVRLPIRMERLLVRCLVTPRMHGIHHSQVRRETNSNYGVVFCWWDTLHRTLGLNVPQSELQIGIAGYSQPEDNRLWYILTLPFRQQRDYWRNPDGTILERNAAVLKGKPAQLAE